MADAKVLAGRFGAPEGEPGEARLDRILVTDLVLACNIGIHGYEKHGPQRVRFNLDLSVRPPAGPLGEDVSRVVSYEEVIKAIRALIADRRARLTATQIESWPFWRHVESWRTQ